MPSFIGLGSGSLWYPDPILAWAVLTVMEFLIRYGKESLEIGIKLWLAALLKHPRLEQLRYTLRAA